MLLSPILLLLPWQILDCFVDASRASPADPGEGLSCAKGAVLEALLSRSLAHPHILPTYDYAFSEVS